MATVEYDLDTTGGLMDEIQKLIAPPMSEESLKRNRRVRGEYRRNGRTINRDCCDSCKEGGDLICCDRCPASFHLLCHDPPLCEDDLPNGEWLCHRCKIAPIPDRVEKDDDNSSTCSNQSRQSSTRSRTPRSATADEPVTISIHDNDPDNAGKHPLSILARAARIMNPVQFDLPKPLACHTQLQGSSKRRYGRQAQVQKKLPHELDNNGLVPLPAKVCFVCSKSCRVAPLIQCDYCPLLFHMDCLTPPLSSLPSGRWMCPNHAEHLVDEALLKSTSLSERIKLWDEFCGPVNQHAVKLRFLQKIHSRYPPFRVKLKHPRRSTIAVPDAIKKQYIHRPELLQRMSRVSPVQSTSSSHPSTLEEQETWLTSVVQLQNSIAKYLAQSQINRSSSVNATSPKSDGARVEPTKPMASVQPVQQKEPASPPVGLDKCNNEVCEPMDTTDALLNNHDDAPFTATVTGPTVTGSTGNSVSLLRRGEANETSDRLHTNNAAYTRQSDVHRTVPARSLSLPATNHIHPAISTVSASGSAKNVQINSLSRTVHTKAVPSVLSQAPSGSHGPSLVKIERNSGHSLSILTPRGADRFNSSASGSSRLTDSGLPHSQMTSKLSSSTTNTISTLNSALQTSIENSSEIDLGKLDERLVQILAWQRLQQLIPTKPTQISHEPKKALLNGMLTSPPSGCEVRARAVLTSLSGSSQSVSMSYRSLTIGTGADMDVCLSNFGSCNYVSAKHAHIFYDEMSRQYELLNYSEHGTTVDNVLYSCDFSHKPAHDVPTSPLVAQVRGMTRERKAEKERVEEGARVAQRLVMSARSHQMKKLCGCKGSASMMIGESGAGWEGTALLHHGSYIKVGCLQFVLSIVDERPVVNLSASSQRAGQIELT